MKNLIIVILFLLSFTALAQPTNGPGDPPPPVPITGIEILIAAGGLFGAKKLYDKRKGK